MIHVLYSTLCELIQKLLLCFVKTELVGQKTGKHLCEIYVNDVENMRTIETLEVGEATKKAMSTIKKEQHKSILLEMRGFFVRLLSTCKRSKRTSLYARGSHTRCPRAKMCPPTSRKLPADLVVHQHIFARRCLRNWSAGRTVPADV